MKRSEAAAKRLRLILLSASCLTGLGLGPGVAHAQSDTGAAPETVETVVVTASRRSEAIQNLPFNISALSADQLKSANITSMTSLSQAVPNFIINDVGAGRTSSSIPIIRGINASQPVVTSDRYFQSPVGLYQDNTPITGYQPLLDVSNVEVLRGPQGTLYGAGSLAGAVRIVPNAPDLSQFSGQLSVAAENVAHSQDPDSDIRGMLNIPISDTFAIRIVADREHDGGFIDQNDILKREHNNYVSGVPVLADPGDVANSPAVYFDKKDVNYTTITAGRISALWQPSDDFQLRASYSYSNVSGNGEPVDNNTYQGGTSPIDSRFQLAPTGDWERSLPMLEPYSRVSQLASIDTSYDVGFATLATTVSYGLSRANLATDETVALLGSPYGFYYTGAPANPRTVIPVTNPSKEEVFTEEVRLVSKEGGAFDYIAGLFSQQDQHFIGLNVWDPGADTQSAAAHGGSTLPIALGGTYILLFPDNSAYQQPVEQHYREYAAYGDLTWHLDDKWQITGGARLFHEDFSEQYEGNSSFFFFDIKSHETNSHTGVIFKANTSYKLDEDNNIYATWSQGFRRGGSNVFPLDGPVQEPAALLTYKPDKTNNYEIGAKGTLGSLYYSADLFYIDWSNVQIDLLTPYNLQAVVVNANGAASRGFEAELSGPVGPQGLSFSLGLAYARARLTDGFALPAGSGTGFIVPDAIVGKKGDRLPGAPDFSLSANANYTLPLDPGPITFNLGVDYRSSIINILPNINPNTPAFTAPAYALLHGSIELAMGDWNFQLFGTNLTDAHIETGAAVRTLNSIASLGNYGNGYTVERPREVGLRITRNF